MIEWKRMNEAELKVEKNREKWSFQASTWSGFLRDKDDGMGEKCLMLIYLYE